MTSTARTDTLRENLAAIRARIEDAARKAGRDPSNIALMGATKTVPADIVAEAVRLGLSDIGENWIQEAEPKYAEVSRLLNGDDSTNRWHMIGHLQRNKVKQALSVFDAIDTVDSLRLAAAIDRRAAADGHETAILLEIDYTDDTERGGFRLGRDHDQQKLDGLLGELEEIVALPHIRIEGLMTVAPQTDDPEGARPGFVRLRELQRTLAERFSHVSWKELSTGMSHDFPIAIEEGATVVRIGTAIFGQRPPGRSY